MQDARSGEDTPALPSRAQVVIVGGGVIGCSVAYHLTKLGWTDVVLLERHQLTAGTTWHAAGLVVTGTFSTETTVNMSKYSRDLYKRLGEETGQDTGFRDVGYLEIATDDERVDHLRRLPDDALHGELTRHPESLQANGITSVTRIGDCLAPGTIAAAVYSGHRYVRELDEPDGGDVPYRRDRVTV